MNAEVWIGVDVAAAHLDVAVHARDTMWQVANDDAGIAALIVRLAPMTSRLVVLEATGGFQDAAAAALTMAGIPVVVANPRQVRDFARAAGKLAKTDQLDARVLAHYAAVMNPTPRALPDAATRELNALVDRRRQLQEMLTMERNRQRRATDAVRPLLAAHIA